MRTTGPADSPPGLNLGSENRGLNESGPGESYLRLATLLRTNARWSLASARRISVSVAFRL